MPLHMIRKPGIFAFVSVYFCFNIMIKMWERWVFNLDFFLKWGTVAFQCYVSSAVQWNKSAICVHISFPSHPTFWHHTPLGHHGAPHWASCAVQQAPTRYLFYIRVHNHVKLHNSLRDKPWKEMASFTAPGHEWHLQDPSLSTSEAGHPGF